MTCPAIVPTAELDSPEASSDTRNTPAAPEPRIGIPVDPADLVVLAISVVVAILRAKEFVAGKQHRSSLRQQQSRKAVAPPATTQRVHLVVVGRTLGARIPGMVVGLVVLIVLTIRLVVLVVVGDQVIEGEAIMGSDEVRASGRDD
jgi:biotin carboxyl carrier protein